MEIFVPMPIYDLCRKLMVHGGASPRLVGGYVRDQLLGLPASKDIDIEVYGVSSDHLHSVLSCWGEVNAVGKQFGVFKMKVDDFEVDISLPRRDSCVGTAHKEVDVTIVPDLGYKEACERRDFTVNAILYQPIKREIIDPLGGVGHLEERKLIPCSKRFSEDPLRPLRAVQLSARFNLKPTIELAGACVESVKNYHSLTHDRIMIEWMKFFERGIHFPIAIETLSAAQLLWFYPDIKNIWQLPQDPRYHPEGTVCVHSALTAQYCADICQQRGITGEDRLVLVAAGFCHDLGKGICTEDDEGPITIFNMHGRKYSGGIGSKSHDKYGIETSEHRPGPVLTFLRSIHLPERLIERIAPLCREHMIHVNAHGGLSASAVRRLAVRLHPASIRELDIVIQADHAARPPLPAEHPCPELLRIAEEVKVKDAMPKRALDGGYLIARCGMKQGKELGDALRRSYDLQLEHGWGKEQLEKWAVEQYGPQ